MSEWPPRYRLDGSTPCIDIRLKGVEQLFDNRDPAPFRERDLDYDAVEYLVDAADEIPATVGPLKVVLWLTAPLPDDLSVQHSVQQVRAAYAHHFEAARHHLDHRMKRQRTLARGFSLLGLVALILLLMLAELSRDLRRDTIGHIVPEGLTILAWVVMWRPLESLLFDWWPLAQERKSLTRIGQALVEVHAGEPPAQSRGA